MKIAKDIKTVKWILRVAGSGLGWMFLLVIIRFLQGSTCILYAYGMKTVIDCATAGNAEAFRQTLAQFVALVCFTIVLQASGRYVLEKSRAVQDRTFRLHIYSQIMHRDYYRVTQVHSGEWMNRIVSDTAAVVNAVATILPEVTGMTVRMFGSLLSLLMLVPHLALIICPAGLLIAGFSLLIRSRLKGFHKKIQQADGTVRSAMQERMHSLLVIRVFGREKSAVEDAAKKMDAYIDVRMQRARLVNLCTTALGIAMNAAQVLGIGLCGWGILQGTITYGTMSSTLYLINLLDSPLSTMSNYIAQYYAMLGSAERLMEIETYPLDSSGDSVSDDEIRKYYRESFASLGFRQVCFRYEDSEDAMILDDLSLNISKGSFVSFTGASGCGKSTALKILMDLYPPAGGCVYMKDFDGTERPLNKNWRGLFAYVPQGNQLIAGTIREMLSFGDALLMKQDAQIWTALEISCADKFVRELKDGLDTVLGEQGSGLSEGQMQRLSIARAILSDRPVLLLDEATSALDPETEQQLLRNLRAMTDKTVLIISHREAVREFCDLEISFSSDKECERKKIQRGRTGEKTED